MTIDELKASHEVAQQESKLAKKALDTAVVRQRILSDGSLSDIHALCGASFEIEVLNIRLRSTLDEHGYLEASEQTTRTKLGPIELYSSDLTTSISESENGFACFIKYRRCDSATRTWTMVFQDGSNADSTSFDRDAIRAIKAAWGLEWDLYRIAAFIKNTLCSIAIGADQLESLFDDD